MGVSFTKAQRERAKKEGTKLCAIHTPHVSIDGPCTQEEHDDIVRFLHAFLKRRFDKRKAEREATMHGEQPRCRRCGGTREVPAGDGVGDVFECPDCQ